MPETDIAKFSGKRRFLIMLLLVISGETIFFLPFILPRVFRPTLLDVFNLTNFELGSSFSAYGIVAMVSYFFGGPLADRFAARNLMTWALISTAIGGLIMATIPSFMVLTFVYAFWGMTTILLFWSALIRATREWGGIGSQGKAFGLLDAGRGLAAALISTAGIVLMVGLLPEQVDNATLEARTVSFQWVILLFSLFTLLVAGLVWVILPASTIKGPKTFSLGFEGIKKILKMRVVWLQSIIILCGYVGYKITDDFSLYAQDVLGFNEVKAAAVGTLGLFLRPIVAITAGYLADRYMTSKLITISFLFLIVGGLVTGSGILQPGFLFPYIIIFISVAIGVYSLRPLYFAVMEEGEIPFSLTGTAVGIVSVVGYTPDIFVGPLMGLLLDHSPGEVGHRHLFLFLTLFACFGLVASILFRKLKTKK